MPVLLVEYFEDFANAEDAYSAYLEDLQALAGEGTISAQIALQLAKGLQQHVDLLNAAFAMAKPDSRFASHWQCKAKVFIGDARGRQYTRFIGGDRVVALDWMAIIKLVLLLYWIGWDGEDPLAQGLAAFLLVNYVVEQNEELPYLEEFLVILHKHHPKIFGELLSLVGDFFLFHELGHIYCDQEQPDHLSIKFVTQEGYEPAGWLISQASLYDGSSLLNYEISADGSQVGAILLHARGVEWEEEFACDAFSLYGLLYASSGKVIAPRDIHYICDTLSIWQMILWILDWKQLISLSRKDISAASPFSHPPTKLRFDCLLFHTLKLAADHLPPDVDIPLGPVMKRASKCWGSDMNKIMDEAVQYSFYGFDEDSDKVNVGKLRSFTEDGKIPYHPSAFEQLRREILVEFIPLAKKVGWNQAAKTIHPKFKKFIDTYRLDDRPVIRELGEHLHHIGLRLISENRS